MRGEVRWGQKSLGTLLGEEMVVGRDGRSGKEEIKEQKGENRKKKEKGNK